MTDTTNHLEIKEYPGGLAVRRYEDDRLLGELVRPGVRMVSALIALENAGWSCNIYKDGTATARRGAIVRIDYFAFVDRNTGQAMLKVHQYPQGWTAATQPAKVTRIAGDIDGIRAALAPGWDFISWDWNGQAGARCFLGTRLPVRSAGMIQALRARLNHLTMTDQDRSKLSHIDLAYNL
jgi:hypothetical protein